MFETAADEHINDLIEELCRKASRLMSFQSEDDQRQLYINQIAQLRASQNPIVKIKS